VGRHRFRQSATLLRTKQAAFFLIALRKESQQADGKQGRHGNPVRLRHRKRTVQDVFKIVPAHVNFLLQERQVFVIVVVEDEEER